ncbi:MAG TPA: hypothetical protein ENG51_14455 [Deltaproteobacteria bacterium]|nr:MAG: hypothetical protein DRG83_00890 [Deltaproteobacteria bacterium]RLB09895.1 MAG: hypothetical protein DRG59_00995 [Deltaproteobacteria bacterium]HDM77652.1 hypothetical protein [Deltaproteobacteria bacterium]HEC31095.1 hypothetical protein [Deltaproteobacteria bacterium]
MALHDLLAKRKDDIVKKWFELVLETYPEDSRDFFRRQKNRFANPMGYNIKEGIAGLFEAIVEHDCDHEKTAPYLDQIIRIRAVQEFSPSEALSFVMDFKKLLRNEISTESDAGLAVELDKLEEDLDKLALQAFDIYMGCRERIFELRVNELRNLMFGALERANLVSFPGEEKEVKENKI